MSVIPVVLKNFDSNTQPKSCVRQNIGILSDLKVEITIELGRTSKSIRDILSISQGSIIELDKLSGEPLDIFANGKLVARGEVVVIDEKFGVRVVEVLNK